MYRKYTQAITLIELLAVMVIILIIAGMFVGVSGPASKSAKKRKAEVMISALEVAIGMYKADTGLCPPTDSGNGSTNLYDYLTNEAHKAGGAGPVVVGWGGPYMEFKAEDKMGSGANTEIKDPWKNSYKYETPGTNNTKSFDLWSYGPDGANDKGAVGTDPDDDIYNW